jgi:hypothetical protein
MMLHTGSVRRKWWSSGSTRKYLNIEFDQKRSIRSWRKSAYCTPSLDAFAYPIVYLTVPDWVVDAVTAARCCRERFVADEEVQVLGTTLSGPVRKEGLFATAGRPEPDPPLPPVGPFVAMAVGKTKEGESLPAKPGDALLLRRA